MLTLLVLEAVPMLWTVWLCSLAILALFSENTGVLVLPGDGV